MAVSCWWSNSVSVVNADCVKNLLRVKVCYLLERKFDYLVDWYRGERVSGHEGSSKDDM